MIVGPDLVYRPMNGGWVGQRDQPHDRVVRRGVTEAELTRYVEMYANEQFLAGQSRTVGRAAEEAGTYL